MDDSSIMDSETGTGTDRDPENDVEEIKVDEMKYYRSALNFYKATSLSLEVVSQKIRSAYQVPNHLCTSEVLQAKIQDLQNDITLLKCLDDVNNVIHENFVFSDVLHSDNNNPLKSVIVQSNDEITYFSKSIMNLYSNKCNDLDLIQKGRTYIEILEFYQNHLEKLKNSSKKSVNNPDDTAQLEKCKSKIEKINLMRAMKSTLIAKLANDESRLPELQKLRSSSRRNLTLEDFEETWDKCYN